MGTMHISSYTPHAVNSTSSLAQTSRYTLPPIACPSPLTATTLLPLPCTFSIHLGRNILPLRLSFTTTHTHAYTHTYTHATCHWIDSCMFLACQYHSHVGLEHPYIPLHSVKRCQTTSCSAAPWGIMALAFGFLPQQGVMSKLLPRTPAVGCDRAQSSLPSSRGESDPRVG